VKIVVKGRYRKTKLVEVKIGRNHAVLYSEGRFKDPGNAGYPFGVTFANINKSVRKME
jgi:hypothetical protein